MTRFGLLAVLALAFAGCGGSDAAAPPERPPEYAGLVEEADGEGRLLVRAEGDACGIWVAAEEDVHVFRATREGGYVAIGWDDVRTGARAELWIPGPIAESCPMQGAAEAVVAAPGG